MPKKSKKDGPCFTRTNKAGQKYTTCVGEQKRNVKLQREISKLHGREKKKVTKAEFDEARKGLQKKVAKPKATPKSGVVSLEFLKELSEKKGYSFDPNIAFKTLKVGDKQRLLLVNGDEKVVEVVSSDDKGITFNEYNFETKRTKLHDGPNTQKNPKFYVQTILGDKKKGKYKVSWSQYFQVRRTDKSVNVVSPVNTKPRKNK